MPPLQCLRRTTAATLTLAHHHARLAGRRWLLLFLRLLLALADQLAWLRTSCSPGSTHALHRRRRRSVLHPHQPLGHSPSTPASCAC